MKTLVISAVNIRKGGTLTILRQCLEYLSSVAEQRQWRVVAIVHRKALCHYPAIDYIELPDVAKSWGRRLWCEYVTMHRISKELGPIDLWLSLHDTTPRVQAQRQAVYCQTSFPFLKWKLRDLRFDPKIVLFALLTRFAYRINIHRNSHLIVQAEWLRKGFSKMFRIPSDRFIVAPPQKPTLELQATEKGAQPFTFFFPSTPDCHKNFELACQAAKQLEQEVGAGRFQLIITIKGDENSYARWLYKKWGSVDSIRFAGFLTKEQLFNTYAASDCLLYPARVETWGLAISEYSIYQKPMLLADLPYAHETAAGHPYASFFDPEKIADLQAKMHASLDNDHSILQPIPAVSPAQPIAEDWEKLFEILLQ